MAGESYEGWKNRQTWAVWLEWTNDYGLYQLMRTYCKLCIKLDKAPSYKELVNVVGCGEDRVSTGGFKFLSKQISLRELNAALQEEIAEIKKHG